MDKKDLLLIVESLIEVRDEVRSIRHLDWWDLELERLETRLTNEIEAKDKGT